MPTPQNNLCDGCHQKEATHHVHIADDGMGRDSHLCDECFKSSMPREMRQFTETMMSACCQYCGDQASMSATDFLKPMRSVQQVKYMCHSCAQEFYSFIKLEAERFSKKPAQQPTDGTRTLYDCAEEHMRQWVSGRKGNEGGGL